jgi:hypothetical protein
MSPSLPDLTTFLAAPASTVAQVAPTTAIFAAGGTRRAAALASIPFGEDFARWSRPRMLMCFDRFFQLGVRHLCVPILRPQNFAEVGLFRERILSWLQWGLAGPESLATYQAHNWQVRLIVTGKPDPELAAPVATLATATCGATGPRLWYIVTPDLDGLWTWQRGAFLRGAQTRAEAVEILYGEAIPPATMLVGFGKPLVGPDLLPPLLVEEIHCYWRQRPGYSLTERELRLIFYDYAYLRPTWQADKTNRGAAALAHRAGWERGPTLGLGMRLGAFWYPALHADAAAEDDG